MTQACACGVELGSKNKSGRCRACGMRLMRANPDYEVRRAAAYSRRMAEDPEWKARHCAASAARLEVWRRTEEGGAFFKANSIAASAASNTAECRARRAAAVRKSRTGWCPDDRRSEYLKLRRHFGAVEARRIIEADLAQAERRRVADLSPLERQLERVRAGARVVDKPDLRPAPHTFTLGGVASASL